MPTQMGRRGKKAIFMALTIALLENVALGQTITWDASGANPAAPVDGGESGYVQHQLDRRHLQFPLGQR